LEGGQAHRQAGGSIPSIPSSPMRPWSPHRVPPPGLPPEQAAGLEARAVEVAALRRALERQVPGAPRSDRRPNTRRREGWLHLSQAVRPSSAHRGCHRLAGSSGSPDRDVFISSLRFPRLLCIAPTNPPPPRSPACSPKGPTTHTCAQLWVWAWVWGGGNPTPLVEFDDCLAVAGSRPRRSGASGRRKASPRPPPTRRTYQHWRRLFRCQTLGGGGVAPKLLGSTKGQATFSAKISHTD